MTQFDGPASWLRALFDSIDAGDTPSFLAFLTPDAEFRFGSAPPVRGHAAIRHAVDGFFSTIAGCRHRLNRTWQDDDTLVCEGTVTYRRHDGSEVTLPFANVFALREGRIPRYSIYADVAPLYAAGG